MNIFFLDIHKITKEEADLVKKILPNRYKKALEYKNEEDYLRSLGIGLLIIYYFKLTKEAEVLIDNDGRYYIEGYSHFSVSHDGEFVIFVSYEKHIGLDVLQINLEDRKSLKDYFCKEELKWLSSNRNTRFYILSAQKESVIKILGKNLNIKPVDINVIPFETNGSINYLDKTLYNKTVFFKDYVISVTTLNAIDSVSFIDIKSLIS